MQPVRLLKLGASSWIRTQSIYHAIGYLMDENTPDTIVLMRPQEPYLCVGYHQPLNAILDRKTCTDLNLPIVRRRVGGGTTYLDENQQFYQCIFHHKRLPYRVDKVYELLLGAPIRVLQKLGLNAALRGGNEIEVDHLRIAGIGGGRIGDSMIVVGNILLDFDYETMAKVWHTPTETFRQFAYETMQKYIVTLWGKLGRYMPSDDVQDMLIDAYSEVLQRPVEEGTLTEEEWQKVEEMERNLISEAWITKFMNDENRAMNDLKISRGVFIHDAQIECGNSVVDGTFEVKDGIIQRAKLRASSDNQYLIDCEEKLINKPFSEVLCC